MTVTGAHVILYSPEADALRALLRDTFGWRNVDAGGGWLIFALPPAEIAVHPSERPTQELSLMCDDLDSTMADLSGKGIGFKGEPHDERWGRVTTMVLPGGVDVMLYEPRHATVV